MLFNGINYNKTQLRELHESDDNAIAPLFDWLQTSVVGECVAFYDKILFHTNSGFFAAYANNLSNNWKF